MKNGLLIDIWLVCWLENKPWQNVATPVSFFLPKTIPWSGCQLKLVNADDAIIMQCPYDITPLTCRFVHIIIHVMVPRFSSLFAVITSPFHIHTYYMCIIDYIEIHHQLGSGSYGIIRNYKKELIRKQKQEPSLSLLILLMDCPGQLIFIYLLLNYR